MLRFNLLIGILVIRLLDQVEPVHGHEEPGESPAAHHRLARGTLSLRESGAIRRVGVACGARIHDLLDGIGRDGEEVLPAV